MASQQPTTPDPFAAMGGGVFVNGGWVPQNHPLAQQGGSSPGAPPAPAASSGPAPSTPDPFAAMGGGVQVNGGWVPSNHPAAQQGQPAAPAGTPAGATPPSNAPAGASPDPFAALGGGVYVNGAWVPQNHPLAQQPGAIMPPGVPQPGTVPVAPGTPPGTGQPAPGVPLATNPAHIQTPFYSALSGLLQLPQTVTADDPQIRQAINANKTAEQRGMERARAFLAERNAAQGFSESGAADSDILGLEQARSEREGRFGSDIIREAQRGRMGDILAALGIGQGIMTEGDRAQLQRELATLDAQLRREGFDVDRGELDLRRELGTEDLDLRRYLGDLSNAFNMAQLGQSGEQFDSRLAAELGMFDQDQAQRWLIALLNASE